MRQQTALTVEWVSMWQRQAVMMYPTALLVMRADMAQRAAPAASVQETAQLDAMHWLPQQQAHRPPTASHVMQAPTSISSAAMQLPTV